MRSNLATFSFCMTTTRLLLTIHGLMLFAACTPGNKPNEPEQPVWGDPVKDQPSVSRDTPSTNTPNALRNQSNNNGGAYTDPKKEYPEMYRIFSQQATAMTRAHNQRDYKVFLQYAVVPGMSANETHMDQLIARLKKEDETMAKQGIRIDSLVLLPITELEEYSGSYYTLIPKKMYLRAAGKRNLTEGHLLGYTHDGGKHCYFVDLDNISEDDLYQLLPDVEDLITWPGPARNYRLP